MSQLSLSRAPISAMQAQLLGFVGRQPLLPAYLQPVPLQTRSLPCSPQLSSYLPSIMGACSSHQAVQANAPEPQPGNQPGKGGSPYLRKPGGAAATPGVDAHLTAAQQSTATLNGGKPAACALPSEVLPLLSSAVCYLKGHASAGCRLNCCAALKCHPQQRSADCARGPRSELPRLVPDKRAVSTPGLTPSVSLQPVQGRHVLPLLAQQSVIARPGLALEHLQKSLYIRRASA